MSEARKFSSVPNPMTSGLSLRAATTWSGSFAWITAIAYEPTISRIASRTAASRSPL